MVRRTRPGNDGQDRLCHLPPIDPEALQRGTTPSKSALSRRINPTMLRLFIARHGPVRGAHARRTTRSAK
jgi:hypothetical protein